MAAPRKYEAAEKAGNIRAAKTGTPPPQSASTADKKTTKNNEKKKDGGNSTRKDGARYRSQTQPYANSFRKVMADWMSVNFPDDARDKETWPSELGKRRPKNAVEKVSQPTLVQYLGWLDSLEDRDEASANNTSTKRYWQKFCQQTQNKKMVTSWMEFARDIRTADGLLTFRPAFGHVNSGISTGGPLHPLIFFPSANEFKEKTDAALVRQNHGHGDADGSKEDEAVIRPWAPAGNKKTAAAPTKRTREDIEDEDDEDYGDAARHLAKKPKEETEGPSF